MIRFWSCKSRKRFPIVRVLKGQQNYLSFFVKNIGTKVERMQA